MKIHIAGPSGAGKTTIGNKLKEKFKNKIVVKDIDDLRSEFIKEFYGDIKWTVIDKKAFQKYIDDYIEKIKKPLILTGLNIMPWWHKNLYYDLHSDYKFYIEIDNDTLIKQKCLRLLNDIQSDKIAMDELVNDNQNFIKLFSKAIKVECDAKNIIKMNKKWNKDYKKQDYKFMSRENIFKQVCKLLK